MKHRKHRLARCPHPLVNRVRIEPCGRVSLPTFGFLWAYYNWALAFIVVYLCYQTKADIWFYLPATKCDNVGVRGLHAWARHGVCCREQGEREAYPYFCTSPHYFDACLLALASSSDAVHVRCLDTGCCWQGIRSKVADVFVLAGALTSVTFVVMWIKTYYWCF